MQDISPHPLAKTLEYTFIETSLLEQALTHPSITKTRSERHISNQRLEFLGDRVLGLCVAHMLFDAYPDEEEGAMAKRHTALVRKETLARVARSLELGTHIILSESESDMGGRDNDAVLADACEALIAALYLDGGLDVADRFIRQNWTGLMQENMAPPKDAKTTLQEFAQARGKALPSYKELSRTGPAHAPVFTIEVSIDGYDSALAEGGSKRQAEQMAAGKLLELINERTT